MESHATGPKVFSLGLGADSEALGDEKPRPGGSSVGGVAVNAIVFNLAGPREGSFDKVPGDPWPDGT
eukprot:288423-Alexandrium_andersonii.AAC.1